MGNNGGKGGRHRLPDALKKQRGTYKPSRASGEEPVDMVIDQGEPMVPLTDQGQYIFDVATTTLIKYNILTEVDINLCTLLALSWESFIDNHKKPQVEFLENGNSVVSAYSKLAKDALKNIMQISTQLGITPVMRSKLRAFAPKESQPKDPFSGEL